MQSRLMLNLLMLTLLAVLASFVFLYHPEEQQGKQLTSLAIADINSIVIARKKTDIKLKKTKGAWQMISPFSVKAHDFRIQHLLKLSQYKSKQIYSANNLDLKSFSLDKPRARIKFNDTWIEFGTSNPVTQQRYIKSSNTIMLIHDDTYPLIRSQSSSFVDLSLLEKDLKILRIKLPDQTLYQAGNSWQIKPAISISADDIQTFIQNWKMASAFGIHAYLQRKQLGSIEIETETKKIHFVISDKQPWLILARPELGIEYHLDASMANKLLQINITDLSTD